MESKNFKHLPGVDHLRAFAAIVVYHGTQLVTRHQLGTLAHAVTTWPVALDPFTALLIEGHTSVALFSGFIFSYGAHDSDVAYWGFLRNRFLRTYPSFLFLMFVGLAAYPERATAGGVLLTLGGFANYASHAPYLGSFSGMFWALGVEWKFYAIFPFLHRFMREAPVRYIERPFLQLRGRYLN